MKKLKRKKVIVTGCAGFIGSNLVDRLLNKNFQVIGIDNLSTGQTKFIEKSLKNKNFKFIKMDLINSKKLNKLSSNVEMVFHFAANADVRFGYLQPKKDLRENTIATSNILEFMRKKKIKKIIFCSTGSIYGEAKNIPTAEDENFPIQTSFYGASKLAGESLIQAYCNAYNMQAWIFRFVSILGERYIHGHVYDFCKQLFKKKSELKVLGNGFQKKSYLHVEDCINAIFIALKKSKGTINIFNLGTEEFITVRQSIKILCKKLDVKPKISYAGGRRGWIGDNPFIFLKINKMKSLGWRPKYSIKKSLEITISYLSKNKWVFKKKK